MMDIIFATKKCLYTAKESLKKNMLWTFKEVETWEDENMTKTAGKKHVKV